MYNFKLPEDVHGYRLPRTIEEAKRDNYAITSYIADNISPTMTDEEAEEWLKKYNPEGLYKGFLGNNPMLLKNSVIRWLKKKMKEEDIDQRIFRRELGYLEDAVVDPNSVKIISSIYDPHDDQYLMDLIRHKKQDYHMAQLLDHNTLQINELILELSELEEQFNAEPYEIKEAVIPAGTVIKTNINISEMLKIVIQKREQQIKRAFGL